MNNTELDELTNELIADNQKFINTIDDTINKMKKILETAKQVIEKNYPDEENRPKKIQKELDKINKQLEEK